MSETETVYRTSSARTGKMMIIMLGICIVGGAIFFGMWDYWISQPPPVVAQMSGAVDHGAPAVATGETITQDLKFVQTPDGFTDLAFNALTGEEGHNPTINANVGDKIIFNVLNQDGGFHAFGVTAEAEGFAGIIPGSEVASAAAPLQKGDSDSSEFVPTEPGTYYYICTVPGHRELGMVGEIIVGESEGPAEAAAPTGVSHDFTLNFVESEDGFSDLAFNALTGEEGHNPDIVVNSGDEVTITAANAGKGFHAFGVVASPDDFNNALWGSEIASATAPLKAGESGSTTFTAGAPGTYYYICTVPGHAALGMQGSFIVE
ncbi:MAG: plastocyanin/azurin family copper-binding protein [Nitrosopumilus sp.]|nr:plastocyanin/azurin family copper-binding protein [Nitrosopumilus sp.]MDH3824471.1 plastocyanin/azurin family copper-binding protein [Nitrosopumilus sp.]